MCRRCGADCGRNRYPAAPRTPAPIEQCLRPRAAARPSTRGATPPWTLSGAEGCRWRRPRARSRWVPVGVGCCWTGSMCSAPLSVGRSLPVGVLGVDRLPEGVLGADHMPTHAGSGQLASLFLVVVVTMSSVAPAEDALHFGYCLRCGTKGSGSFHISSTEWIAGSTVLRSGRGCFVPGAESSTTRQDA